MTATASCEGRSYRPGLIPELHNVGGVAGGAQDADFVVRHVEMMCMKEMLRWMHSHSDAESK